MKSCNHPTCEVICRREKKTRTRSRIRPVSKKQAKRLRRYSKEKKEQFKEDNICAVALIENKTDMIIKTFSGCQYFATEKHHPRGRLGERLFDEGIKLCSNCHRIAEIMPELSKKLGISKSRLIN